MKKRLIKSLLLGLTAILFMGCNEEKLGVGNFSLELKKVAADYVEIGVTAPSKVEMAYMVTYQPELVTPFLLFVSGTTVTVNPGETLRITKDIFQDNDYHLYAVAKVDSKNYSEVFEFNFKTPAYNFTDLLTVVETYYDGYKIHIHVPESVKNMDNVHDTIKNRPGMPKGNAIRFGGCCKAWYNVMVNNAGGDETITMLNSIVANGNREGNFVLKDSTIIRNSMTSVELDEDGNPVLDNYGQTIDIHDPIAPGEPTVFFAGECRWGTDDEMGDIMNFYFGLPDSDKAYVVPLFDWEKNNGEGEWVGEFQKIEFKAKEPTKCSATVAIEIPDKNIKVTDAQIKFTMKGDVDRYIYMILDETTYNGVMDEFLMMDPKENTEEEINKAWQWFLSSYVAFYQFGCDDYDTNLTVQLGKYFGEGVVQGEQTYHVLCTVFGDEFGYTQNFVRTSMVTKPVTKKAPIINITALDEDADVQNPEPFTATFNIKAPNKDVDVAYYACNYAREFEMTVNGGTSYETILKSNYEFDSDDINKINSDQGLTMSVPTLDGEITRLVVYGRNDENTYNNFNYDADGKLKSTDEGKGWADYNAPMQNPAPYVPAYEEYRSLEGEWTATARLAVNKVVNEDTGATEPDTLDWSSKINISYSMPLIPEDVTDEVYKAYEGNENYPPKKVEEMYEDLKIYSSTFEKSRIKGQNRLLCTGFVDYDPSYNISRLSFMDPYKLFIYPDYVSYDVAQIIYDFGPKWFFEVQSDGSLVVPLNSLELPPLHGWPGYPFYLGAVGKSTGFIDMAEGSEQKGFPVEVSEDGSKITIKPIYIAEDIYYETSEEEETEGEETEPVLQFPKGNYYMNAIGSNNGSTEVIGKIVSEIVLTRTPAAKTTALRRSMRSYVPSKVTTLTPDGQVITKLPEVELPVYKNRTDLSRIKPEAEYVVDEKPNIVTMEMVEAARDEILRYYKLK